MRRTHITRLAPGTRRGSSSGATATATAATRSAASRRIFIVVNKQDLVSPDERADALRYLREQLNGLVGSNNPRIFSVSARDGLEAKRAGSAERLAASGILAFEQELVRFLIEEKSSEFLLGIVIASPVFSTISGAIPTSPECTGVSMRCRNELTAGEGR
jgi:hypothetical protein